MRGAQFETRFIRPAIQQAVRDAFARYTEEELGRGLMASAKAVQAQVRPALSLEHSENGFMLGGALLRKVRFTNEFIATRTAEQLAQATATATANKN